MKTNTMMAHINPTLECFKFYANKIQTKNLLFENFEHIAMVGKR